MEFVAGFEEEKEKLLELRGKKIIFDSDRSSRSHNVRPSVSLVIICQLSIVNLSARLVHLTSVT